MNDRDALEQRLEQLESRQAFQDDTQNSLSDVLARQAQEIATLQRQVEHLAQRLQEALEGAGGADADQQPPPHY